MNTQGRRGRRLVLRGGRALFRRLGPAWGGLFLASVTWSSPSSPEPTASEPDSIPEYRIEDPIEVSGVRIGLREIIQRCVEGEKTKLSGHRDMTYHAEIRSILTWEHKRREIIDEVYLVYEDDRGVEKRVQLTHRKHTFDFRDGHWIPRSGEKNEEASLQVEAEASDRGKDLARLPFFLEDQAEYDFELLERHLDGNDLIFKIAFRPRSRFKPLPSGVVYVDAGEFRIIHEEFTFEQNPVPLLLKGVRGVSRQWAKLPGGQWVVSRILGDVDLQGSWTGVIPGRVEFAVLLNDYRFDRGYDERRFGPYGAK